MKIKGLTPALLILLLGLLITGNIGILAGPLTNFMEWAQHAIGGPNAVGWSIIILTLAVRIVLMPMMIQQQYLGAVQQEKMRLLQPQLKKVQEAQKAAKTPEEQMRASQAMMAIYRENGVSMLGGMNFTALIIQWPIFIGLYDAIKDSPDLAHASFYGISLAQQSMLLAVATGIAYMVQAYLSMLGVPEDQKKTMAPMMMIMPIMMFFMTYVTNGGIALYFFVGGLIMIFQTLLIVMWRPRIKSKVVATFEVKDVADAALDGTLVSSAPQQEGRFAEMMRKAQEQQAAQMEQQKAAEAKDVTPKNDDNKLSNAERNAGKQPKQDK